MRKFLCALSLFALLGGSLFLTSCEDDSDDFEKEMKNFEKEPDKEIDKAAKEIGAEIDKEVEKAQKEWEREAAKAAAEFESMNFD